LDNENFKYVDVTAIDNAVMLKERIFSRMRILAEKNKYGIFETTELGSRKLLLINIAAGAVSQHGCALPLLAVSS